MLIATVYKNKPLATASLIISSQYGQHKLDLFLFFVLLFHFLGGVESQGWRGAPERTGK